MTYRHSTRLKTLRAFCVPAIAAIALLGITPRAINAAELQSQTAQSQQKIYRIGFHWWKPGKIYDEAMEGIKDGLELQGIRYEAVVVHSNRDKKRAVENLRRLDNMALDIIYSFSSAGTQIARNLSLKTPIIATVINHPASLGVKPGRMGKGSAVSGTSYYVDAQKQLELYLTLFQVRSNKKQKVGMIFDLNNPAGVLAEEPFMRKACNNKGIGFQSVAVENKSELHGAIKKLLNDGVTLVVVPTNRLVYGNLDRILSVTNPAGIPIVSMNKQGVENGALAALFADTYNLGRQTAQIADQILRNDADPAQIGFEFISNPNIIINLAAANALNYQFPPQILGDATIVLQ